MGKGCGRGPGPLILEARIEGFRVRRLMDTHVAFRPCKQSLVLKLPHCCLFMGAPHCGVLIPAAPVCGF